MAIGAMVPLLIHQIVVVHNHIDGDLVRSQSLCALSSLDCGSRTRRRPHE